MNKKKKPRHPGQVLLEDFLCPRKIPQIDLSVHLRWTYARLNEIINGRRGLTPDSALALAEAFNTDAEFWMDHQRDWELWRAKKEHKKVKPIEAKSYKANPKD
jgi:antitoxin HigA-1